MRTRELVIDVGWLLLLVLLIPVAIPAFALLCIGLLGKRLYDRYHRQPAEAAVM